MADNASATAALDRLEKAFARIEAATRRVQQGEKRVGLEARYRHLQDEVQAALTGLDRLLDSAETR